MNIEIEIDSRERDLIKMFEFYNYPITTLSLKLGDVVINKNIVERKTLNDLSASIKDGRYKEQSFRLQKALEENYKVYYMIEGNIDLYTGSIPKESLIRAMFSLTLKGFQVISTKNTKETAYFLIQFSEKLKKIRPTKNVSVNVYEENNGIVSKQKNTNITKDNISIFMLCQIPGISVVTASILMDNFKHITPMIEEMKKNTLLLDEFEYINPKNGNSKKLNKNIIQNLKEFLFL